MAKRSYKVGYKKPPVGKRFEPGQSGNPRGRPKKTAAPIPVRLPCPVCAELHVDKGAFATKPHHTHACQNCGHVWRPAVVDTVGVKFLPGFKD